MQAAPSCLALGWLLHLFPPPSCSTSADRRSACPTATRALPAQLSVHAAACSRLGRAAAHPPLPTLAAVATAVCSLVHARAGAHPAQVGQRARRRCARGEGRSLSCTP